MRTYRVTSEHVAKATDRSTDAFVGKEVFDTMFARAYLGAVLTRLRRHNARGKSSHRSSHSGEA